MRPDTGFRLLSNISVCITEERAHKVIHLSRCCDSGSQDIGGRGWIGRYSEKRGKRGSGGDKWPPQCGVEAMGEATVRKSPWLLCPLMHRALLIPFHDDVILRILRAPVILFSTNVPLCIYSPTILYSPHVCTGKWMSGNGSSKCAINRRFRGSSSSPIPPYPSIPHSLPQWQCCNSSSCLQWMQSVVVAHHTVVT